MQSKLTEKLWAYIVHNNPDLVLSLQEDYAVTRYLKEKVDAVMPLAIQLLDKGTPQYIIEEQCLKVMIEELKPSRYQYICSIIEEEFSADYRWMKESGTLTYEVANLIRVCKGIFNDFGFNGENEANRFLRYAIAGQIHDYLK